MRRLVAILVVVGLAAVGCTNFTAVKGGKSGIPIYAARPYLVVRRGAQVLTKTTVKDVKDATGKVTGKETVTEPVLVSERREPTGAGGQQMAVKEPASPSAEADRAQEGAGDNRSKREAVPEPASKPVMVDTVSYEIVYLADLDNAYGLQMSAFLGKVQSNIKIEDGWRLASSDATVDTQAAETIKAVAEFVSKMPLLGASPVKAAGPTAEAPERGATEQTRPLPLEIWMMEKDGGFTCVFPGKADRTSTVETPPSGGSQDNRTSDPGKPESGD